MSTRAELRADLADSIAHTTGNDTFDDTCIQLGGGGMEEP